MSENKQEIPLDAQIRRLMRGCGRASLATVSDGAQSEAGWPHASLVLTACDHDGAPLLLLSQLAEHTRHFEADPRVSLLYDGTIGLPDPLTGARATVVGRVARQEKGGRMLDRFLRRHASAEMYAGFGDFHLYRVAPERAHFVAGFGKIDWVEGADLLRADWAACALAAAEAGILEHMREDHDDAIQDYARFALELDATPPEGAWRMTGVDPEGFDLRREGEFLRLDFRRETLTADQARAELVRLVRESRAATV